MGYMNISRRQAKSSVGSGWAWLIDLLYDQKPRGVKVVQVKEKFGTLRFYVNYYGDSGDRRYEKVVSMCEHESAHWCEQCGRAGKIREDLPWILTLCDEDYEKEKQHYV